MRMRTAETQEEEAERGYGGCDLGPLMDLMKDIAARLVKLEKKIADMPSFAPVEYELTIERNKMRQIIGARAVPVRKN